MDDISAAKILINSLDLTSLNTTDDDNSIKTLCQKAFTPYGNTASVCIYPQFIHYAKTILPKDFKIATVINFPTGDPNIQLMQKEISAAIKFGADELDVVLPYRSLLDGNISFCQEYLIEARKTSSNKTLKIIIESGELKKIELIKLATKLCIDANADFVKTSTGKTDISATPEAANAILETIAQSNKNVGFKASGGIKTFEDAKKYLTLCQSIMGANWVNLSHFRLGASSVLTNLLNKIKQGY
ncbi:MAG: deoxyribose-phosphate aldolase [Alphaproteobacteria bacterium]|nr:deoxyribose-phosphate aldolase [Alphaproteobacteria bacterium]